MEETYKRCPKCRRLKNIDWNYCEIDGAELVDEPSLAHPLSRSHLTQCPACRSIYDVGFIFCPSDGEALTMIEREPVPWDELPFCSTGHSDPRKRLIVGMPIGTPDGVHELRVCDPYPCWYYRDGNGEVRGLDRYRRKRQLEHQQWIEDRENR
jgi:hypothetical protein